MAKIEINVKNIVTTIDQMWKMKGENDKYKNKQKETVRKSE